jgi:predicted DNA-binding protein
VLDQEVITTGPSRAESIRSAYAPRTTNRMFRTMPSRPIYAGRYECLRQLHDGLYQSSRTQQFLVRSLIHRAVDEVEKFSFVEAALLRHRGNERVTQGDSTSLAGVRANRMLSAV